jgi:hypothetical protein
VASLRYAGPVVDELKQLIYHSGSLLLVGSTQVALVDHPRACDRGSREGIATLAENRRLSNGFGSATNLQKGIEI